MCQSVMLIRILLSCRFLECLRLIFLRTEWSLQPIVFSEVSPFLKTDLVDRSHVRPHTSGLCLRLLLRVSINIKRMSNFIYLHRKFTNFFRQSREDVKAKRSDLSGRESRSNKQHTKPKVYRNY